MQKIISLSIAFCLFWNPCFTQDTENISPSTESEEPGRKEKRETNKRGGNQRAPRAESPPPPYWCDEHSGATR